MPGLMHLCMCVFNGGAGGCHVCTCNACVFMYVYDGYGRMDECMFVECYHVLGEGSISHLGFPPVM